MSLEQSEIGVCMATDRGQYFADGTRRLQRNFGITEDIAEWLRVAAFTRNVSQSELAREAFTMLRDAYKSDYPAVEQHLAQAEGVPRND